MFFRKYWIPLLVFIVAIVGVSLYVLQTRPAKEPIVIITPVEPLEKPTAEAPTGDTSQDGHFHADGTWHAEPHDVPVKISETSTFTPMIFADGVNPTSTSSNPLFQDGVPEHLQCPPELIGVYFEEIEPETLERLQRIGVEILEKWNPNRPLTEVYPAYIKGEKWYHDNADPERARADGAAGRIDWALQQALDFPEISVLSQEDSNRAFYMRLVELGYFSRDSNQFTLPDGSGRTFRTDGDKQYVFRWGAFNRETADGFEQSEGFIYKTGPSNGDPNAEVIEINLDEISDEALEALKGWDYNINPYTTGAYKLGDNK